MGASTSQSPVITLPPFPRPPPTAAPFIVSRRCAFLVAVPWICLSSSATGSTGNPDTLRQSHRDVSPPDGEGRDSSPSDQDTPDAKTRWGDTASLKARYQ